MTSEEFWERIEIWGDMLVWSGSFMWLHLAAVELLGGSISQAIAYASVVGVLVCWRKFHISVIWHLDRWKERAIAAIENSRKDGQP